MKVTRKARKAHECTSCDKVIKKGESYTYTSMRVPVYDIFDEDEQIWFFNNTVRQIPPPEGMRGGVTFYKQRVRDWTSINQGA